MRVAFKCIQRRCDSIIKRVNKDKEFFMASRLFGKFNFFYIIDQSRSTGLVMEFEECLFSHGRRQMLINETLLAGNSENFIHM